MKPLDIIKTLINEIDPSDEFNGTVNVGLAVFVNDKYHKLTLEDLRQYVSQQDDPPDTEKYAGYYCKDCGKPYVQCGGLH